MSGKIGQGKRLKQRHSLMSSRLMKEFKGDSGNVLAPLDYRVIRQADKLDE